MTDQVTKETIRKQIQSLSVWRRGDQRAPHKPLLLLLTLSRIVHNAERLVTFTDIEDPLKSLLERYGPPRQSYNPAYPFWRLQNDGIWEIISGTTPRPRLSNTDPPVTELRRHGVQGGLLPEIYEFFRTHSNFLRETTASLLEAHFPASLHADILSDLGIVLNMRPGRPGRSSTFRSEVVQAYEHCCAICGYDIKVGGRTDLGLEAAHIKWHQAGGPNIVNNGLALCAIHHKALDLGAIGIDDAQRTIVSGDVHGQVGFQEWFMQYHLRELRPPHSPSLSPAPEFLAWHRSEVFRDPARE